jgi:hypothetical protein
LFRTAQVLFPTAQTLFPTAQALREIQNWLAKSSQSFQHQWLVHFATESQGAKSKQKLGKQPNQIRNEESSPVKWQTEDFTGQGKLKSAKSKADILKF